MDTSWVKPIVFHQETKDWLASLQWPATAYEDFDQIRRYNEKFYRISGMKPPATQPTNVR